MKKIFTLSLLSTLFAGGVFSQTSLEVNGIRTSYTSGTTNSSPVRYNFPAVLKDDTVFVRVATEANITYNINNVTLTNNGALKHNCTNEPLAGTAVFGIDSIQFDQQGNCSYRLWFAPSARTNNSLCKELARTESTTDGYEEVIGEISIELKAKKQLGEGGGGFGKRTDNADPVITYALRGQGVESLSLPTYEPAKSAVHPNPAHDFITVPGAAEVYDMMGARVAQGTNRISISGLNPGIYHVKTSARIYRIVKE